MPATPAPQLGQIRGLIAAELPGLVEIRHDLHRHPELGYQERRTSAVIASHLSRWGIEHVTGLAGGTGVVAHLPATVDDADAAPCIALRADIDALPIQEQTGLPYASQTPGLMHACGHDGHTTNLLGVARVLSHLERRPCHVTFIFQPAEEGGAGGRRMCEDGVLDGAVLGPSVDAIFGLHGWPQLPAGVVATRPGPLLAATDSFRITVVGTQAHAAYPHYGRDPIVAAAHMITALQTVVSRSVGPLESVVVTVGTIQGGTARNIIPETVVLNGTLRTLHAAVRERAMRRFDEIVAGTAAAMGCGAQVGWEAGYPVTSNDAGATERFFRVARAALGPERVVGVDEPTMGGEDFAFYGRRVPACFFFLGVRPRDRETYPTLHQPDFDFNDEALPTGIETMCALATDAAPAGA